MEFYRLNSHKKDLDQIPALKLKINTLIKTFFICLRVHLFLRFMYLHAYMYLCVHFVHMGLKKHSNIKLEKLTNTLPDSIRNVTYPTNTPSMCALCKLFSVNVLF